MEGDYSGGVTVPVAIVCIIAASCGLIFGYDVGVTGNFFLSMLLFV
jgi:MFS transporter, SP family, sugar:H+ symporter